MNKFMIEDLYNNKLYYFCGIQSPQIEKRATITEYSTSAGTKISDNSYVEPKTLSFTLHLSEIAMYPQKVLDNDTQRLSDLTMKNIQDLVDSWLSNAIRLNITTFTSNLNNMVLSDIIYPEKALGIYAPMLTFKEVRQANVEYITIDFPRTTIELASNSTEQNTGTNNGISAGDVGRVIGTVGSGAAVGAIIGSVFPGPGNIIGAGIGAVYGLFQGLVNW